MKNLATTPFGGARLTARNFKLRANLACQQSRLAQQAGPDPDAAGQASHNQAGTAEKWQVLRALSVARTHWGLSDRALAVLEALASFHTDRHLDGRAPIIVFPSNAELSLRARGMSPATLRRHLAGLVDAGMILRRDSANGKRYCRRDDQGQVESAFGFDLAPLALRSDDIFAAAERARDEARRIDRLRADISLHLRDIAKTIAAGEERLADVSAATPATLAAFDIWRSFAERLAVLSGRVARNGTLDDLGLRRDRLSRLRTEVETAFLNMLTEEEMSANAHHSEHHIQNTKPESPFDKNGQRQKERSEATSVSSSRSDMAQRGHESDEEPDEDGNAGGGEGKGRLRAATERKSVDIRLDEVLAVCPDIADYARGGAISNWSDMMGAAEVVRSMLGISPSAWAEARAAMGAVGAAITLAAMLQRSAAIRSPGGYLRDLTARAQAGRFSVRPMLKALA